MTCPRCNRRVYNSKGEHVRYCKCGLCNHCHISGVLYTGYGNVKYPHWYKNSSEYGSPAHFGNGQSHGGHGWIPDNTNHVHQSGSQKHHHGGHKKRYGGNMLVMSGGPSIVVVTVSKPKHRSSYKPKHRSSYLPKHRSSYLPKPIPTPYQRALGLSRYRAPQSSSKQHSVASLLGFEYI